jgi:hypothetical protein
MYLSIIISINAFDIMVTLNVYFKYIIILCKMYIKYIVPILAIYTSYFIILLKIITNDIYNYIYKSNIALLHNAEEDYVNMIGEIMT